MVLSPVTSLRVWGANRGVLESGRNWLSYLLSFNDHLVGRVFSDNHATRKLIQLLGFRLTGYDHDLDGRVVEVHILRRGELVGPRPKDIR